MRFLRIFLGIHFALLHSLLEYWIAPSKIIPNVSIESFRQSIRVDGVIRILGGLDILVAPCQLPRVQSHHADIETAIPSALKERKREFIVMSQIELEEPGAISICLPHILNRMTTSSATIRLDLQTVDLRQYGKLSSPEKSV